MHPPQPHGLSKDFVLTTDDCQKLNFNTFVANLPLKHYTSLPQLSQAFYSQNPHIASPKTAHQTIKSTLKRISNSSYNASFCLYCDRVWNYLNNGMVRLQFLESYNKVINDNKQVTELAKLKASTKQQELINLAQVELLGQRVTSKLLKKALHEALESADNENDSDQQEQQEQQQEQPLDDEYVRMITALKTIKYVRMITALKTIKETSTELHQRFSESNSSLSAAERNTMCLGLSSILDFVNEDSEGQRSLFTEADWAILRSCSKNRFGPEPFELPSTLDAIWDQVVKLCRQGKSSAAKSYVARQLMDEPSDINLIKGLEIIEQLLITLKRHAVMLDPINLRQCLEYDLAFKIWIPLIDSLFGDSSPIATKIAETTNGYSATMKQQQYPASGSIISFKIDFRILLHHHHYQDHDRKYEKDIDLAAGEAAKNIEEAKVKADHEKLAREAKDVLDRLVLVNIDGNEIHELQGVAIQLAGLQGEISTIHLHESGVYVLIPGSRLTFPQSYASLQRFYPTMKALLQLRAELEATALVVLEQLELAKEKRNSLGTTFGRPGPSLPESQAKRSKKLRGTLLPDDWISFLYSYST